MGREPVAPLEPGWVLIDGRPLFHRCAVSAGRNVPAIVHVHGFGISGTYLEPTAARLATKYRNYVPDLPGMGRSHRPPATLDIAGLARALIGYCDAVGVDRATFLGNSLGCAVILEVATLFPDRIERAVLVSPAGGQSNQPLPRALTQMARDAPREPVTMLPIATRDYLRFGVISGLRLFRAMTRYPTLDRLRNLVVPTLVVIGERDPLVRVDRIDRLAVLPHVAAVTVPGAHALNFSSPDVVAELTEAFLSGRSLRSATGSRREVVLLDVAAADDPPGPGTLAAQIHR